MTVIDMTGENRIVVESHTLKDKILKKYRQVYYLLVWHNDQRRLSNAIFVEPKRSNVFPILQTVRVCIPGRGQRPMPPMLDKSFQFPERETYNVQREI